MCPFYLRQAQHTIYTTQSWKTIFLPIYTFRLTVWKHVAQSDSIYNSIFTSILIHHHQPKVEISKRNQNDAFIGIFLLIHFLSPHQSSHHSSELFLSVISSVQMTFSALKTEVHCYSFYAFLRNPPPSECKTTLQRALEWAWPLLGCRQRPAH